MKVPKVTFYHSWLKRKSKKIESYIMYLKWWMLLLVTPVKFYLTRLPIPQFWQYYKGSISSLSVSLLLPLQSTLNITQVVPLTLITQDQPVKGKPYKAVWLICLYIPAERPSRYCEPSHLNYSFVAPNFITKLYPEATQDIQQPTTMHNVYNGWFS